MTARSAGLAATLCLVVLATGCAIQPGTNDALSPAWRFSYLSTEPGPLAGYQLDDAHVVRDVEVVVENRVYFWVPSRVRPPALEEAIQEALRRGGGNLLIDAEVDRFAWYLPPFFGREGWRVRGDVVRVERPDEPELEETRTPTTPGLVPPAGQR